LRGWETVKEYDQKFCDFAMIWLTKQRHYRFWAFASEENKHSTGGFAITESEKTG